MSKMRKIDGYMTLEASMVFPIVFMVFFLFISFSFYIMNCGIAQGIMEEETVKAADTVLFNGNRENGKFSYRTLNQRNLYTQMLPGKLKIGKETKEAINQNLKHRLFLGKVSKVSTTTTWDCLTVKVETKLPLPGAEFFDGFGIHLFLYQGEYKVSYMTEVEKVRRWSSIESAVD